MNSSASREPALRHLVMCVWQKTFRSFSVHNVQNDNPHSLWSLESTAEAVAAQRVMSGRPACVHLSQWRAHRPRLAAP